MNSKNIKEKIKAELFDLSVKYNDQKTKQLEKLLTNFYENELYSNLTELNNAGLNELKKGYEQTAAELNQKIKDIKNFIAEIVFQVFNIDYKYDNTTYLLSEKNDFYIDINRAPSSFLIEKKDLIYLLPKKHAIK